MNETRYRTNTGDGQLENLYKENGMSVGNGMQEEHKTDITKFCIRCGAALSSDEIALHKELYVHQVQQQISRGNSGDAHCKDRGI